MDRKEANIRLADQEIPRLLRNLKIHYRDYKSQPTGPCLESRESSPHHLRWLSSGL
jgi:hypothetical protein